MVGKLRDCSVAMTSAGALAAKRQNDIRAALTERNSNRIPAFRQIPQHGAGMFGISIISLRWNISPVNHRCESYTDHSVKYSLLIKGVKCAHCNEGGRYLCGEPIDFRND